MARPRFSLGNFGGEGMAKVVGFVRNVLAAALSCFCGCFSGERYHRLPEEDFESHNRSPLSSMLICDDEFLGEQEESGDLLCEDTDIRELGSEENVNSDNNSPLRSMVVSDGESLGEQEEIQNLLFEGIDFRELKDEAKFLKTCGVLSGTPAEIRKWSEKLENKSAENRFERSLKFKLWLYNESTEKSKLEKPSDDESPAPAKFSEEWVTCASPVKDTSGARSSDSNNSDSTRTRSSNSIKSAQIQDTGALSESPSGPLSLKSDSSSSDSATSVTAQDQIGYTPIKLSEELVSDFSSLKDTPSENSLKDTNSSYSTRTGSDISTRSDEMENTITTNDAFQRETLSGTPSGQLSLSDSSTSHSATPVTQNGDMQNIVIPIDLCNSEIRSATPSITPMAFAPIVKSNIKSVRFKCDPDESSCSSNNFSSESGELSKRSGSSGSRSVSKLSPYPTPLKITDDMQTPGTVFASYMRNMSAAKTARIRSQYVYSDQNWNPSLWKEFVGKLSMTEPHNQFDEALEMCTPLSDIEKKILSDGKGMKNEASLSYWLKMASAQQHANSDSSGENYHCETIKDNLHLAADNEEISDTSPKMWKGNGIPNTNNKYKEDRKVSWHETPFEERLQKAISGETSIRPRNPMYETLPIEFNEAEEDDKNALIGNKSSDHSK